MSKLFDYLHIFGGTTDYTNFITGTTFVDPHFSTYSNNSDDVNYNPYLFVIFENASTVDQDIPIINSVPDFNSPEDWFDFIEIDDNKLTYSDLYDFTCIISMSPGLHYVTYKFVYNNKYHYWQQVNISDDPDYPEYELQNSAISLYNIIGTENYSYVKYISLPNFFTTFNIRYFLNVNTLYIQKHIDNILTTSLSLSTINNICKIIVDRENQLYSSINNCIINNNKEIIFGCKNSIIPYNINKINYKAFYNCVDLEEIDLSNINSIDDYAFGYTNLKNIDISKVNDLNNYVFYGCKQLETVNLGNDLNIIKSYNFYNCEKLKNINLGNITKVYSSAFYNCKSLETVDISNVTYVGDSAFRNCNIKEIIIPNATLISTNSFRDNSNVENLDISSVQQIGTYAFCGSGYGNIEILNIPSCCTSIGNCAFLSFEKNLKTITVDQDNPNYTDNQGMNYIAQKINNNEYQKLILGCRNSGTTINNHTNCLPESVEEIGDYAFCYCEYLQEINFPETLRKIGADAFYYCNRLQNLHIPKNVTSIAKYAFGHCASLKIITVDTLNQNYSSLGLNNEENNFILEKHNNSFNTILKGCINTDWNKIPDSVTTINVDAFYGIRFYSTNNGTIILGENITNLDEPILRVCDANAIEVNENNSKYYSLGNCIINRQTNNIVKACKNAIIPTNSNIKTIGNYAFYHLYEFNNLDIPSNIEEIGVSAFEGCIRLTKSSDEYIEDIGGTLAATWYSGILVIPSSVKTIKSKAFFDCYTLELIEFHSEHPENITVASDSFDDRFLYGISVPEGYVNAYKTAWKDMLPESILEKIDYFGSL